MLSLHGSEWGISGWDGEISPSRTELEFQLMIPMCLSFRSEKTSKIYVAQFILWEIQATYQFQMLNCLNILDMDIECKTANSKTVYERFTKKKKRCKLKESQFILYYFEKIKKFNLPEIIFI